MEIRVWQGDITTLDVDAVVNAANRELARGSGVCGAIFRGAGPALDDACAAVGGCATGDAVATSGFDLPARFSNRLNFSSISVAVTGRNLKTWTKVPNIDPEFSYTTGNYQGIEFAALPNPRSWGLSFRITP